MSYERLPKIIWDQISIVADMVDLHGSLFLPKPTATVVFNVSSPPKYGSSLRDGLKSRPESKPVSWFLRSSDSYVARILKSGVSSSDKDRLQRAIEYLQDYAKIREIGPDERLDQHQQTAGFENLAEEISKLQDELNAYKSIEEVVDGSNAPTLPLSRGEMSVLRHSLSLAKESVSLPNWTIATKKQIAGVAALLEQLRPMIEPISRPLKEVWNNVLSGLKSTLSALQFPDDNDPNGDTEAEKDD